MTKKEFYTTRDIAQMLNIKPQTVGNYIRSGRIKALTINHTYIVTKKDLDAYLEKRNARKARNAKGRQDGKC